MYSVESLEGRLFLSSAIKSISKKIVKATTKASAITASAAIVTQPTGPLTGKIVYTSGGHGYTADAAADGAWLTGRPLSLGIVEDFGNQDQMTQFVYSTFNAGATVVPMRPVGTQPNEVILDNTSAGVTFTGAWSAGGTSSGTHYFYANNATPTARYMFAAASATETAVARYTPTIPAAGLYPVYADASFDSDRLVDQTYRVAYDGGVEEVKINHRMVGNGWIYLGSYYFNAGTAGYVEISNKSSGTGNAIADAIRFGNGVGDIARGGAVSGHTREDEASLYWVQKQAQNTYVVSGTGAASLVPSSTYSSGSSVDSTANVAAPIRWATFMNNQSVGNATDRVYISFHTNATGDEGGSRGTLGLYNGNNNPATKTPHQYELALATAREINDDLTSLNPILEYPWFNKTAAADLTLDRADIEFGEINNSVINNEFDATIDEVAFHDNTQDAADLLDPKVRVAVAHATTQGVIRYFNTYAGVSLNFAPDVPTDPKAFTAANGDITVSWAAPAATAAGGDAATGYLLQSSTDGKGFDAGISVTGTSYTFAAADVGNGAQFYRIVAINAGGQSPTSTVVAARKNPYGRSTILIVNGFDRLDRTEDPTQTTKLNTTDAAAVTNFRVRPQYSNSFDYVSQAGLAIAAYGVQLGFDSVQNEDVTSGAVNLASYDTVIWMDGEESTANQTFSAAEQSAVANFVSGGGHFFVSGSEIGYDLVGNSKGASFYTGTLHAGYGGDSASTHNVTGASGSIFAGLNFSFDDGTQYYNVDSPDRLTAAGGSTLALNYVGGTADGAAIQYSGSNGSKVVNFGFPFETITTAASRASVMSAVLTYFGVGNAAATPTSLVLAAASDTGISNSDGTTRLNNTVGNTLQFTVSGTVAGDTVSIFADGKLIGSAVAGSASTLVTTTAGSALADGNRSITATQAISGRPTSAASTPLTITVDTIAPTLASSVYQFNTAETLQLTTSESVGGSLDKSDFTVSNLTAATTISSYTVSSNGPSASLTFSSPGLILPDGNYRVTLNSAGITDVAGNALTAAGPIDFFVLTGDINRDRYVDIGDLGTLAGNWQKTGATYADGDFNYDGKVDIDDLGRLAGNWQKRLPPPAAAQSLNALPSNFPSTTVAAQVLTP